MDFWNALLYGLGLGLSTLMFVGPVLFYILKASVESGKRAGYSVSVGILVGDAIYVILILIGLADFFYRVGTQKYLAIAGALILVFLGVKNIVSGSKITVKEERIRLKSNWGYFLNGFLVNFVNPFVISVWVGFYGIVESKIESKFWIGICFIIILTVIFATDLLKSKYSERLQKFVQGKRLKSINLFFGIIMIIFSLRLFYEYYQI